MFDLFEQGDLLSRPIECFEFIAEAGTYPVKPHWHYYMEIIYITHGEAYMVCDDKELIVKKGELVVVPSRSMHSVKTGTEDRLRFIAFKFDIGKIQMTPRYAPKLKSIFKSGEKKGMRMQFSKAEADSMNCETIFNESLSEVYSKNYGYDLMLRVNICKLLMKVIRIWQEEGFQIENETFALDDKYTIDSITEYIDSHINENLKVEKLARECGMSYSYFAKNFLKIYGRSCKEYIEHIRMLKVEDYLLFTDFDLNYISQETGYSDCSHLIKSFKGFKGETPAQYRRRRREA